MKGSCQVRYAENEARRKTLQKQFIVTAAAGHIPPPLIRQLKNGGRMVIPVGGFFMVQSLVLVSKDRKGEITTRNLLPVRFVPLTGGH